MYKDNNFTAESVVIGIDQDFSLIKSKNHIFSNGVSKCNGKPPVAAVAKELKTRGLSHDAIVVLEWGFRLRDLVWRHRS